MTTPLLAEVGLALYGPQWQSALARDLGVSDRTIRRWAAGQEHPPTVYDEMLKLVSGRYRVLRALASTLRTIAAKHHPSSSAE
jgi:predicted transcriptional regulator